MLHFFIKTAHAAFTFPEIGKDNIGTFVQHLYSWSIAVVGLAVFVQFLRAGFAYFYQAAGNASETANAKTMMTNAVIGAMLLASSYLILYVINPDLVDTNKFRLDNFITLCNEAYGNSGCRFPQVQVSSDTVVAGKAGKGPDPLIKTQEVENAFNKAGITKDDNVLLNGMHASIVNGMINLKNICPSCGLNIIYGSDEYPNGDELDFKIHNREDADRLATVFKANPAWTVEMAGAFQNANTFTNKTTGVVVTCYRIEDFWGRTKCTLTGGGK